MAEERDELDIMLCAGCSIRVYLGGVFVHSTSPHTCLVGDMFKPREDAPLVWYGRREHKHAGLCKDCFLKYFELYTPDERFGPCDRLAFWTVPSRVGILWDMGFYKAGNVIPCRVKRNYNNTKNALNKPLY